MTDSPTPMITSTPTPKPKSKSRAKSASSSTSNKRKSAEVTSFFAASPTHETNSINSSQHKDYLDIWNKTNLFQNPSQLPAVIDIINLTIHDHVTQKQPVDQTDLNMLIYTALNLLQKSILTTSSPSQPTINNLVVDLDHVADIKHDEAIDGSVSLAATDEANKNESDTDSTNSNNGFPKRFCKTYRNKVKSENNPHKNLPFNPRDPLLENPEEGEVNSLQLVSGDQPLRYEYPFFLMTVKEINVMDHLYEGFRQALITDKLRNSTATMQHQYASGTSLTANICCSCRCNNKRSSSFTCHRICCVCVYVRVVRGYLWCPVVDCTSQLNLSQLGSLYHYLKRKINTTKMPVKAEPIE